MSTQADGVNLSGMGFPAISDSVVEDNGSYGIGLYADGIEAITGSMTITGNGTDAIQVQGAH